MTIDEERITADVLAAPSAPAVPLLAIRSLSKTYPGQVALDGATLDIRAGEVHALVGQNGSGKSTLIKLLGGYVKADHGADVRFTGQPVDLWRLDPDVRRRIRIVHQDLGLVPTLSATENLGLGRGYLTGRGGRIRWRAETKRAQDLLLRFGMAPDVREPVASLSAAERAAVAIVRALQDFDGAGAGILVLDESTASLDRGEVDALFREVRRVASEGAGVLFVSHVLDEVLDLADRITVLRDGQVVADGVVATDLDQASLVELIVGRAVNELYPETPTRTGRPALEVQAVFGRTLRGVSLKAHRGEVLGVAGLVGSGRDELLGAVFGATPRFAGKVLVEKVKVFAEPRDAIRAGMAFVPADRKVLGLDPQARLVEHVPLPRLGPVSGRVRLRHRQMRRDVAGWVEHLDVQPPMLGRRMEKFSGGNQQKAVLARWLRTEPRVLLLDEPTQGVDIGAKASIYARVADAARDGLAVVVASSDADELVHVCDRVLVMRSGAVATELAGPALTEERLVAETLGATGHRGTMKAAREPVLTRVIRADTDAPAGEPSPSTPTPLIRPPAAASRSRLGRLAARLWRGVAGGRDDVEQAGRP